MIVLPKHKKPFSKNYHRKIKEHHYILLFVSVTLMMPLCQIFGGIHSYLQFALLWFLPLQIERFSIEAGIINSAIK